MTDDYVDLLKLKEVSVYHSYLIVYIPIESDIYLHKSEQLTSKFYFILRHSEDLDLMLLYPIM